MRLQFAEVIRLQFAHGRIPGLPFVNGDRISQLGRYLVRHRIDSGLEDVGRHH